MCNAPVFYYENFSICNRLLLKLFNFFLFGEGGEAVLRDSFPQIYSIHSKSVLIFSNEVFIICNRILFLQNLFSRETASLSCLIHLRHVRIICSLCILKLGTQYHKLPSQLKFWKLTVNRNRMNKTTMIQT